LTEAIAYYNLGASYEHLGSTKLDEAVRSYEIAEQIAKLHLPEGHPLGKTIHESLLKAQGRAKFNQTSHMMRGLIRKERAVKFQMKRELPHEQMHRAQEQV
jgi:hypothetical protein